MHGFVVIVNLPELVHAFLHETQRLLLFIIVVVGLGVGLGVG